jgi:hypothetical protein
VEITHGEREAAGATPQTQLSLVVAGPDLIRSGRVAFRSAGVKATAPAPRLHQARIPEDPARVLFDGSVQSRCSSASLSSTVNGPHRWCRPRMSSNAFRTSAGVWWGHL